MSTSQAIPSSPSSRSSNPLPASGTFVDARYEIVRSIARGSSAEILEARHIHTRRGVVIKMLVRDRIVKSDSVARMMREAKALGALRHPSIIGIHDAGVCKQYGPYLVLDKLEGRSLDGLLATRGHLSPGQLVTVLKGVAAGLAEAHKKGLVHRDIEAGHVFIAHDSGGEVVQILDFGSVGEMTPQSGKTLTLVGEQGVAEHLAPEQLADPRLVDPRSDVYSLGMLGLTCLGVGAVALFQARRERRRVRFVTGQRPDLPPLLVDLLDDMVALSADERPATGEAVLQRVNALGVPAVEVLGYAGASADARGVTGNVVDAPRRRHVRAPYATPVRILGAEAPIDGRSEDISESGLLVVTRGIAHVHDEVTVRFALPTSGRIVSVGARAKWRREHEERTAIGFEIMQLEPAAAAEIARYTTFFSQDS